MLNILYLLASFVPLLVIVGVIVGIVTLIRRRGNSEDEPGIGTLKRLYFYGLSFIALGVATPGVILLIDFLLDNLFGPPSISSSQTELALGLALTLVGAPIWFLHWRLALNAVQQFPAEAQALSRNVFIYLVLGITGALFAFGTVSLFRWLLGSGDFNGLHIAFPLVWGAVWLYHWRIQDLQSTSTEAGETVRRVYVYITSLYGLTMLLVGMGVVIWRPLREAYDTLFVAQVLLPDAIGYWASVWTDTTRTGLAIALVGGGVWWWHWHRVARNDTQSVLRQVYLYLFAILGGAATVVIALSMLLYSILQWFIGDPGTASAATHFQGLPGMIAALVPGAALWGYHWALVQQESVLSAGRRESARRVYRYLVAALGLGTLSIGLVMLFLVALGQLVPPAGTQLVDSQWWRNPLVLGITLLAVGVPVWSYHWFGMQREVVAGSAEERTALSRRIFVYGVFGIATLLVLGNLSAVLFFFFRDLLDAKLSIQLLQDAKWSIGTLLMAGAVSVYYWLVLQEDRRETPEEPETPAGITPVAKDVIALASQPAQQLVRQLEAHLGAPIHVWRRLDEGGSPTLTEAQLDSVRQQVMEAAGDQVILNIDRSGVQVIPYREM